MVVRREEYSAFVGAFKNRRQPIKKRLGQVTAVDTGNRVCSVIVGADQTEYTNVRYYSSFTPLVGADVWIETDGFDMIAVGSTATADTIEQIVATTPTLAAIVKNTTATTSISALTETKMVFNSVVQDSYGIWNSTNNWFVLPYSGFWLVTVNTSWASNTGTGYYRRTAIKQNSNLVAQTASSFNNYTNFHSVSTIIQGTANDTINVNLYTDNAHNLLGETAANPSNFSIDFLGAF